MANSLLYKIAITKIPLVGSINAKNLISHCGGVEAVFHSKKRDLLAVPGIGERIANSILKQDVLKEAEEEVRFLEKQDVQHFFYLDDDYPQRLKHYPDCPIMLYFKGDADLNHYRNVAIVGTRKPTSRGRIVCDELVEELKAYNVQIISGLAYGIDATAHKKCTDLDIPTVGVLGHGLGKIYPAAHHQLAQAMCQNGGLLCEYTSKTGVEREHFPMRNRIIAGLCDALIVVETAASGGSMISANIANTYNKDVFAVPGRLSDKYSAGCNHLIKTHKAALIESTKDIAYIMRWEAIDAKKTIQTKLFVDLNERERVLVNLLRDQDAIGIDNLAAQTQLSSSVLAQLLLELEFKGVVKLLPGKRYMLI